MNTSLPRMAVYFAALYLLAGCATYGFPGSDVYRIPVSRGFLNDSGTSRAATPAQYAVRNSTAESPGARQAGPASDSPLPPMTESGDVPDPLRDTTDNRDAPLTDNVPQESVTPAVSQAEALVEDAWRFYTNMDIGEALRAAAIAYGCDAATGANRCTAAMIAGACAYTLGNLENAERWFDAAIESDPTRVPNPQHFPDGILRFYQQRSLKAGRTAAE